AFGPGTCATTGSSVVIAPGASDPDWGPAEPAAARFVPRQEDVRPPEDKKDEVVVVDERQGPVAPTLLVSGSKRQRFRGALTVGCTPSVAGVCEAVATVKAGRRTFRSKVARKQVAAGQKATLRLRFSKPATAAIRRALKRRGKAKASVKLSAAGATATHAVTLAK
ncbi:MAG TPA: hypothetical protein VHF51_05975, partial [Solirubrobacteraceae bacterium]|nr:hypothetical protein [Solirubrobacteraceae bacterium]